ncbi:branched-chain amino acid ABC transporter permease [Kribbella sancticallisti]|uniref:Branched-chain amino acid ABC transporter permease n=1 Tax=Kribbella sancticallisti TaxID=460087 RepID=A0ABN2EWV4_9ACTN
MRRVVALRRDHPVNAAGPSGAVAGAVLTSLLLTVAAAVVWSVPSMSVIVLLFGINAILAIGYQAFAGSTGIVSFGHVSFMAVGAYAGGIAAMPVADKAVFLPDMPSLLASWDVGTPLSLLIGGLVAAALATIAGPALMRLTGAAASIATLGLLVIVNNVIAQATPITRGPQAFFGVPKTTTFAGVFVCLAVSVALSSLYKWSKQGRSARAVRDQPIAAAAAGISVVRARTIAFVVSAFITGLAGALYAELLTAFSPGSFYLAQTVLVVTMAIIGGISSVTGALCGAALITALNEVLRRLEGGVSVFGATVDLPAGVSSAVMGAALIAALRWRPEGLLGHRELMLGGPERRHHSSAAGPPEEPQVRDQVPIHP